MEFHLALTTLLVQLVCLVLVNLPVDRHFDYTLVGELQLTNRTLSIEESVCRTYLAVVSLIFISRVEVHISFGLDPRHTRRTRSDRTSSISPSYEAALSLCPEVHPLFDHQI